MTEIKRRQMIKSMGALSVGIASAPFAKAELPTKVQSENKINCDILVVGGGTAGTIAAIQAARCGAKTILIESGSQPGGTITTGGVTFPGLFHAWRKQIIGGIGWEIVSECVKMNGDQMPNFNVIINNTTVRHWRHQIAINSALYVLLAEEKCIDAGVDIRYYESPVAVEFKKNNWIVETAGKGSFSQIKCNQIIDCTGNALISSMAGCEVLREKETQPGSLLFALEGYDYSKLNLDKIPKRYHSLLRQNMLTNSEKEGTPNNFPTTSPYNYVYVPEADSTSSVTHTDANIRGRKELLKVLRELKTFPGCENIRIASLKTETAVRETYRISGLYQITHDDYINGVDFEDAVSYSFYPVDLHREGKTIHQEYLENGAVGKIPLRALIPENSKNLVVAGRCVSSDRMANSALRVQASCMGMGQAAAVTAFLAHKMNVSPEDVPATVVRSELVKHGAIVPD
ncbi:FAD-dependent oxidoreductase [Maribellus maritimus]|uniref:FAD-dependent oxidoreductase n=1 Tax=Maribellus maritimus TaxID=2870838 RepID=UPI001EEC1544|nr:FAD-dependent oxidoreductase [Maribellus maritimus]MCG6186850.1 FAD-dependent oxidoreductase [Maribellus maritimus]